MDTVVRGGTVVTCDINDCVVRGDVVIRGRNIVSIGTGAARTPARVLDASGCAVVPGFVQAHVHLCQVVMRGMADDLPLLEWLRNRIWPLEAAHDARTLRASADLGLAEIMLAGTTTILDMGTVHEHDVVMDACVRAGIRAISGKAMMDAGDGVPAPLRESTRASLSDSERLARTWHGKGDGRIGYAWAPRFLLSCSETLVRGAVERAKARGDLMHTHAAENMAEREAVRSTFGDDDVAVLRRWGFSGPRAILAHGVHLSDDEIAAIAREGTRVVHCPSANLKLGSGIARVAELDRQGVALALGADGAPCNNNLDPWTELRHAALLAKVRTGVTSLPARRVLRLATIDGARALGLDGITGSIEAGKRADLVVVRLDGAHVEPAGDVFSRLVYACGARDVRHVLVDGTPVVKEGVHQTLDTELVKVRARAQARRLMARAAL
ncbi:MAG TPA: 5'-deoxyadenosine deaminase [Polyangiaceae bacterium]|jgi:cytosine/adenosine deaminase-related metal-dependent hydrolase|nr:5'-deoxyadenosine deaminase [Polyangiaceae bacterium]